MGWSSIAIQQPLPNMVEVNWGKGQSFHLEALVQASCTDDPAIAPAPPSAGFDTYHGIGAGRYNGVPGATFEWHFTDGGEPGSRDTARITVRDAQNAIVLSVAGPLERGNQQAHEQ